MSADPEVTREIGPSAHDCDDGCDIGYCHECGEDFSAPCARHLASELPRDRMVDGPTAAACFELAIRESLDKHGLDETCAKTVVVVDG